MHGKKGCTGLVSKFEVRMMPATKPTPPTLRIAYKIPCTLFLKKILVKHLGTTPYKLSTKTMPGKIMLGLMVVKEVSGSKQFFGDQVYEIEIPAYYWEHYSLKGIHDEQAAVLLNYHYDKFTENLFSFASSRLNLREEGDPSNRLAIARSVVDYCKSYSIDEDDIPMDTLLKDYYRSRGRAQTLATSYIRKKTMKVSDSKKQ